MRGISDCHGAAGSGPRRTQRLILLACVTLVAASALAPRDTVVAADGTPLYTLTTPSPQVQAYFGVATAAGDLNGDGLADAVVGASGEVVEGNHPGRVYTFSGADASLMVTLTTPNPPSTYTGNFGHAVAAADVNGDGKDEVIVGPYVFSGVDGSPLRTLESPNPQAEAIFGASVAAGDVDGDGKADIIVGAVWETVDGTEKQGRAYVFSGEDGSLLYAFTTPAPQPWALFGYSVAGGDVDGDGKDDIVVGAGAGAGAGEYEATIYVFSGEDGSPLYTFTSPNPEGSALGSGLGSAMAVGDVNGDGKSDVIAGAYGETVGGSPQQGQAYVFSGADGTLLRTLTTPNPPSPFLGALFGCSVAAADVNGDGKSDIIAGASRETVDGNIGQGRAYAFSGEDGALLRALTTPNPQLWADFGVVAAGDVTGDGKADIIVGAPGETVGGNAYQGRAYVFNAVPTLSVGGVAAPPDVMKNPAEASSSTRARALHVYGAAAAGALALLAAVATVQLRRPRAGRRRT